MLGRCHPNAQQGRHGGGEGGGVAVRRVPGAAQGRAGRPVRPHRHVPGVLAVHLKVEEP